MQNRKAWKQDITEKGMVFEIGMAAEEALGIKKTATEETLQSICLELAEIRKELQTIRSRLEPSSVDVKIDGNSIFHQGNHG